MPESHRKGRFDTTSWSLVVAAAGDPQQRSGEALEELCSRYWYPVYAFIRRHYAEHRHPEDLTQAFFARLIERDYVAQADPSRGRFRTFLLTAARNFVTNERERELAEKRGGRAVHITIDAHAAEESFRAERLLPLTPEELFHRRWALTLLNDVVTELRKESAGTARAEEVDRLLTFVTGDASRQSYAELASELGSSEGALRVAVHRLRSKFRERLRRTVAATLENPAEVDDEIRFLIEAVSGGGRAHAQP